MAKREFYVLVEKDGDNCLVGVVPGLKGAYSYGADLNELMENMREVIELCLEEQDESMESEFVGIHKIEV